MCLAPASEGGRGGRWSSARQPSSTLVRHASRYFSGRTTLAHSRNNFWGSGVSLSGCTSPQTSQSINTCPGSLGIHLHLAFSWSKLGTHTRSAFLGGLLVDQQVWYRMRSALQLPPSSCRSTKSNRGRLNPIEGAPLICIFSFVFPLFQIQGDDRAKTQQLALIVSSSPTLLGWSHQKPKLN